MEHLSTKEAAKALGLSDRTLEAWRNQNRGPQYIRLGARIVYDREMLNEWVEQQTVNPVKKKRQEEFLARIRARIASETA
jgi:excisionase family DNA binding protein